MGVSGLLLIAATWRLWTPQSVFPQVPLFRWAGGWPATAEWIGLGVLVGGLLAALLAPQTTRLWRTGLTAFAAATLGMVIIDQHRLQPWAYQFAVMAVVLALAPARRAVPLLRLVVVSIYFHSAVSKADLSFLDTHGRQLLSAVMGSVGLSLENWPLAASRGAVALMPLGELLVAIGLYWRRSRRAALWGAVLMHGLLFLALGPWGLDHKPGVLIWNGYFVVQNVVLFARRRIGVEHREGEAPAEPGPPWPSNVESPNPRLGGSLALPPARLATALVAAVVLLPLLEPFGWFDHWPAWGVYASRPERVHVFVHVLHRDRLPRSLRRFTDRPAVSTPWCRMHLDRWSLDALDAPIYPQDRFAIGAALAVAERYRLGEAIRVEIESAADRCTGRRDSRWLRGVGEIAREADRYVFNARPRLRIVPPSVRN